PQLPARIDVRRLAPMSRSKKVTGRNLGLGIKDFTVTRKTNQHLDTACPIKSIRRRRQSGPTRGQITGERTAMLSIVSEASEIEQHAAFNAQGIAKLTPVAQMLFDPCQHRIRELHR